MAAMRTGLALVLLFASCAKADNVTWQPLFDLEDLFPSFILATATAHPTVSPPSSYIGDPFGLVGVEVKTDSPATKIRVRIDIDQIAETTEYEALLPAPGAYRLYPKIRYRYQTLTAIRQPLTVNSSIAVSVNGQPEQVRTQAIRVRSVNDALLEYQAADGKVMSRAWTLVS